MNRTEMDNSGASRGNIKSYATGFILSIILTAVGFTLVMSGAFSRSTTVFGIFGAAVLQILVHLHCFLHLDASSAARWNVLAFLFTVMIMTFFVGGTLWVMYTLNYRMM